MPGSTNGALLMPPEEDRMQLQDRTAEQVRDWITSKTLAVRRYLLNLQSAFNSTLPVNTLPNEVLVEILRLASASDDSGAWMTAATGVCQYWRDVTLNTPVLWTNIDLSASPRFITLCLDRSRGAGLSMHLPRPEPQLEYLERAKIDFSAITPLLDSHHSRITNIDLYIDIHHDSETSSLWQVLDGSIPALCSLDVEVAESPLPWTPGPLPYLRSLSLTRVTPDWTKLPLSQLTSLKLCLVELPEDGPFASLLNVLKACASLEAFNCDFAHEGLGRLDRRNQHEVDRIMSLPRMRHIQLSGNGKGIKNLLARISLPRCARASLQPSSSAYSDSPSEDRPVLKAFLPTDTRNLPALGEARHVMVWHKLEERRDSETSLIIYADMERTEFWDLTHRRSSHHTVPLDFPFRSPSAPSLFLKHRLTGQWHMKYRDDTEKRIIAELGNVFSASVETLVIRGMANQVGLETWVRMLAAFPNVKSLEIMGGTPCDFPPAFEPTQTGTPCACLRELDLRYRLYRPRDIHDVEDMLQELRAALQKRIEVDGGLRLESLSLLLERTDNAKPFPSTSVIDKLPAGFRDTLRGLETVVGVLVFRCVAVEREESLWQRRRRK